MAQLFQAESIRFGWLPKKQGTDTLSSPSFEHCQSFIHRRFHLLYPSSSSSSVLPVFCSSSNNKPETKPRRRRNSTSAMPDTQLCKELQLFISSQGLPLDKVPSTKELSKCGREDLAKIVRRRGYKAVQALLTGSNLKLGTVQEDSAGLSIEDDATEASTTLTNLSIEEQAPKKSSVLDDTGQILKLAGFGNVSATLQENIKSESAAETTVPETNFNGDLTIKQEEEELRRRAAEFVRTGRLDQVSGDKTDSCRLSRVCTFPVLDSDGEEEEEDDELYEDSSDEEENMHLQNGQSNVEGIALDKAAKLRAKLLPFLTGSAPAELSNQIAQSILGSPHGLKALEGLDQVSHQIRQNSTLEADFEIQEIKSALSNKERELRELSRDLEETKAQLALIQAKAIAEVAQAKQLVLEKEIRLKSADLALANLKRVQVEYWGEGERVELAGSFNGWKYFVLMESDPTSEITKPDGSRGPMMWGTELWLYPGIYEIKFIIDGIWQIDQRREIVTKNSHHNNVLRVEP